MTVHINERPPIDQIKDVWPILKDCMPRCKDCKWWLMLDDEPNWGICASLEQGGEVSKFIDLDCNGTVAPRVYSREDFGCIGWGAREP